MNRTLLNPSARARLHERLDRLSPESEPRWGTMSAERMVCHVADHLRIALGDTEVHTAKVTFRLGRREVAVSPGLLRLKPVRYLFVHRLPWPKGRFRAASEMWSTAPREWQAGYRFASRARRSRRRQETGRCVGPSSMVRFDLGAGMGIDLLAPPRLPPPTVRRLTTDAGSATPDQANKRSNASRHSAQPPDVLTGPVTGCRRWRITRPRLDLTASAADGRGSPALKRSFPAARTWRIGATRPWEEVV